MLEELQRHGEDAAKLAADSLVPLSEAEAVECLLEAFRVQQVQMVLLLRLIRDVDKHQVPGAQGCRSMVEWLRTRLRLDPRHARQLVAQATALLDRPAVVQAVLDRELDVGQAMVIADAVRAIPEDVAAAESADGDDPAGADARGPWEPADVEGITDQAESVLIEMGGQFPPYQIRRLGERILTHVAPEIAERAEAAALRRREARAFGKRSFTLSRPIDGLVHVRGALGVEDAAVVSAALDPLCVPRAEEERTPAQRRADALVDVCRLALRTAELPDNGGEPPQLTVTVPYETLTGKRGPATTEGGERLSAAAARRLACDARILPIVLSGRGQVLDVGRTRRVAPAPLRRAVVARDRGCAFPHCDRPPRWCDLHHVLPWSQGGPTELGNLVLLCGHHHRLLHDPAGGWRVHLAADGLPDFIPPPWTDPRQRPRRNLYHPRK